MSDLAKAYGINKHPDIDPSLISGLSFHFSHGGTLYSYITIIYYVEDIRYDVQLDTDEFFNWIGTQLLKIK